MSDINQKNLTEVPKKENTFNQAAVELGKLVYRCIYYFGMQVIRTVKRGYRQTKKVLHNPIKLLQFLGRIVVVIAKRFADKSFFRHYRSFANAVWDLHHHARRSKVNIKKAVQDSPGRFVKVSVVLFKKAVQDYRVVFTSILNYAAPIAAAAVLAVTILNYSNATFALEVQYNNQNLGYISGESVFLEAEKQAKSRIVSNTDETVNVAQPQSGDTMAAQTTFLSNKNTSEQNGKQDLLSRPTYKITRVSVDKLSDSDAICDKIVENSQTGVTHACGIYVDGEFICAIKNETDARRVFDSILEAYPHDPRTSIADFVEEVELVQGLYADNANTIWDTEQLQKKLNGTKSAAVYYIVQEGDTPSAIAAAHDLTTAQLVEMNPWVEEVIHVGDKVLVSNQVNFLQVKLMKTVHRNVEIQYGTERRENPKMFRGSRRITREGVNGVKQVTELVTYINNVPVSTKQLSEKVIKAPVNARMDVGTKSTTLSGMYGDYDVSPAGSDFVWPVIGAHRISAHYGYYRWGGRHWGVDIAGSGVSGKKIVAVQSGRVTYAGWDSTGHGYRVIINHGGGLETCYSHTKKGSMTVRVGDYVNQGEVIARVGATGNVTGPHLHFEVHRNGRKVNPEPYLGI